MKQNGFKSINFKSISFKLNDFKLFYFKPNDFKSKYLKLFHFKSFYFKSNDYICGVKLMICAMESPFVSGEHGHHLAAPLGKNLTREQNLGDA